MVKINVISDWLELDHDINKSVDLYVDVVYTNNNSNIKILALVEPNTISNIKHIIIKNSKNYDLILSFDDEVLSKCDNSKLFVYGTTWIKDFDFTKNKEYCITTLVGGKLLTKNHYLRQELPKIKNKIHSIPLDIFNSKNDSCKVSFDYKQMNDSKTKNELFYSQFHIAIENSEINNYFTEKIMDCFQTKTVPIYMGCPNIGRYFDDRGIIKVRDIHHLIEVCNSINEKTYDSMIEYINYNYEISKNYVNIKDRLILEIKKIV